MLREKITFLNHKLMMFSKLTIFILSFGHFFHSNIVSPQYGAKLYL